MKQLLFTIGLTVFFQTASIFSQNDYRAEISINGGFDDYAITPSGKFYIATKTGMTYYTESLSAPWKFGPIKANEELFGGEHMERVSFFNDSIGIISGYLHKKNHTSDYIYRTTDGGISWNKITLEKGK
ncbi:MAG: hypothetical protein ACJAT4_000553 [Granulosicoccus sp.]|jgi:hypothetical protein